MVCRAHAHYSGAALKQFLADFEEGFSTLVSDLLEHLSEAPPVFAWLLSLLFLVGAGSITLLYLIIKLFIPRTYHP